MRVLFAGTPDIAVPSLRLIASHYPCTVLTCADRGVGRGRCITSSPVKCAAEELGLTVICAEKLDAGVREAVRSASPDILVVAAFGKIFRQRFLDLFPLGGINLHPSLLPRYRGPSPVSAAILSGDSETGVTIQRIALEVDSGAILAQERVPLSGLETTGSLGEKLGAIGAELLAGVMRSIESGAAVGTPQNEAEATYCRLVSKEDGHIDWREPAAVIERRVRAFDPWPHASTSWRGMGLLVLKSKEYHGTLGAVSGPAACEEPPGRVMGPDPEHGILVRTGTGILAVERLQIQNRKPLDWRSFMNGNREIVGSVLGG
jgi:methionyl-tRNA formyltransferase